MSMTPEEQRIALAEWNGTPYHKPTEVELASGSYYQYEPDYTRDLDSVHALESKLCAEHEKELTEGRIPVTINGTTGRYMAILGEVVSRGKDQHGYLWHGTWHLISATASQRCEALCRTLWPEKWK